MSLRRQGTTLFAAMLAFVGAAVVLAAMAADALRGSAAQRELQDAGPRGCRIDHIVGHQCRAVALRLSLRPRCPWRMRSSMAALTFCK